MLTLAAQIIGIYFVEFIFRERKIVVWGTLRVEISQIDFKLNKLYLINLGKI